MTPRGKPMRPTWIRRAPSSCLRSTRICTSREYADARTRAGIRAHRRRFQTAARDRARANRHRALGCEARTCLRTSGAAPAQAGIDIVCAILRVGRKRGIRGIGGTHQRDHHESDLVLPRELSFRATERGGAAADRIKALLHTAHTALVGGLLDRRRTLFARHRDARDARTSAELGHQAARHGHRLEGGRNRRRRRVRGRSLQGRTERTSAELVPTGYRTAGVLLGLPGAQGAHHLQAAEPARALADEGSFRRHFLPQRRDLFRQGHAAQVVRSHGGFAGAGRLAVHRPLGKFAQCDEPLQAGGPHRLSAGGMTVGDATQRMRVTPPLPPALPALPHFGHIRRIWDEDLGLHVAKLLPGDYYVTRHNEAVFTVLGSCVSACVRERRMGIGGMNHFMLPLDRSGGTSAWAENLVSSATRYGNVAMERLINDIMTLGGQRANLEFKVIGGGKVLDMALDVGARNAQFVRDYLKTEGFLIAAEDLGGSFARKVYYSPATGKVRVKRLTATVNRAVFEREREFAPSAAQVDSGSVELF